MRNIGHYKVLRLWVALAALFQVISIAYSSTSTFHLHEFHIRSLFLLLWGFQIEALRVMMDGGFLTVCQAPLQTSYLHLHWFLSCFPLQVFIWDHLRPFDVENAPATGVIEGLDPLQGCFYSLPGLRSIQ